MIEREYIIIGYLVKEARVKQGLTVQQVADMAGVSRSSINGLERSDNRTSFHVIMRVFKALKLSLPRDI